MEKGHNDFWEAFESRVVANAMWRLPAAGGGGECLSLHRGLTNHLYHGVLISLEHG